MLRKTKKTRNIEIFAQILEAKLKQLHNVHESYEHSNVSTVQLNMNSISKINIIDIVIFLEWNYIEFGGQRKV